jgi:uncharacterized membrane protein
VARESAFGLKLGDFGVFVIFAAIYAAGTLGLPKLALLAYQVKVGEIPTAFVAIFGMPAVLGLTLGQFIANLGVEASPITSLTPIFSFVGLLVIYYTRKFSTLAGCIAYILITSAWLTFLLPTVSQVPQPTVAYSVLAGQFIAVIIGYLGYLLVRKTILNKQKPVNEQTVTV